MKKQIIIFAISLLCAFQMMAQLKLDVEFGSNFSNSQFTATGSISDYDTGNRIGYYIGFVPRLEVNNRLNLVASLQYSEEGFKSENSEEIFRYRYLRLIPELELNIINGLNIFGGISFGYLLDEDVKVNDLWVDPIIPTIEEVDFGVTFGAKYRISRFLFSARYNLGIKDINDVNLTDLNGNIIENLDQQNRTLQLGVGIRLIK